jgi:xanthine dehydrogenase YagR molybdenum-binding subunit
VKAEAPRAYKPNNVRGFMVTDSCVGDVDAAIAAAPIMVEAMYETPFQHHHAMEPHARLASSDGDALTLHVAAQLPMSCRTTIAATLQIPPDKVRIIAKFIGGGFGGKLGTEADAVPSALAAQIRATG